MLINNFDDVVQIFIQLSEADIKLHQFILVLLILT